MTRHCKLVWASDRAVALLRGSDGNQIINGRRVTVRDAEKIVNIILGEIVAAMARGNRVELRGFGAFRVRQRAARSLA